MPAPHALHAVCSCGAVIHADPSHAGRRVRCRCGDTVLIPLRPSEGRARRSGWRLPRLPSLRGLVARFPRVRWPLVTVSRRTLRVLPWLVWGYAVFLAGTAVAMRALGDQWWGATVLLYGPRWLLLLPLALLIPAVLLLTPRLLLPAGIATFLALGPVMGGRLGWRALLAGDTRHDLRLITFNVEGGVNSFAVAVPENLTFLDPDVMLFQECTADLADYAGRLPGWTARRDGTQCIVSRFPIEATDVLEEIATGSAGGTGTATAYRLATPAGPVELVNVHLETPRRALAPFRAGGSRRAFNDNAILRDVGSGNASRWAARRGPDRIVAGDFNLTVESAIYRAHWSECTNAFSRAGRGFGYTRILRRFAARIDHVLACGAWTPVRAEVGPELGSDHRPVIVDLVKR